MTWNRLLKGMATFAALGVAGCATAPSSVPLGSTPYGGVPHGIPGLIETEHYDEGGPGVAYVDVDEVNHGADYRRATFVDIEQRSDASNGHGIGWVREGEWLNYTVDVTEAGTYSVAFPVASDGEGGYFHLEVNGQPVSSRIQIPDTGAWTNLEMIHADNVTLQAGVQTIRLVMDEDGESGGIGDIDYMRFTKTE